LHFYLIVMETKKSMFGMALPSQIFHSILGKTISTPGVVRDTLYSFLTVMAIPEFMCGMALQPRGLAVSQQTI
jgi:hypothetical protein